MQVSGILDGIGTDFGASQAKNLTAVRQILPAAGRALAVNPRTRLSYIDYDWSINDQARRVAGHRDPQR